MAPEDSPEPAQHADSVRYQVSQPEGYSWSYVTNSALPSFDKQGRKMMFLCHEDGSVTWQIVAKDGEVLEP